MAQNRQVDRFLENYRRLEAAAANILPRDNKGSVIARLLRMPKFAPYREELDCCREVRNLLTHEVRVDGEPAIIPGDGMIRFLEKMIDLIVNPPRVKHRMTPIEKLVAVTYDTPVLEMMERMRAHDLSRVPLLVDGVVRGMFSMETVFRATLDGIPIGAETKIANLDGLLALDAAPITTYRFVPPEMTLDAAEEMFYHAYGRKSKIRALLVTEGGNPDGKLLGVLSPYDVLGN